MTIARLRELIAEYGAELTEPVRQRMVGKVPLRDGHSIEIWAPVPVFFSREEAGTYGKPCYVAEGNGERWSFTYTSKDADLGFMGTEEEMAAKVTEYISRNWRGASPQIDALLSALEAERQAVRCP